MSVVLVLSLIFGLTPELPLSIATTDDALAVFANPAGLGTGRGTEFYYIYNFQRQPFFNNNTFVLSLGPVAGFVEPAPLRYGVALGMRREGFLAGVRLVRDSITHWDVGALVRPWSWLSLAGTWQDLNRNCGRVGVGAGVRPFGPRLTLSAETYLNPWQPFVGLEVEPVDGFRFAGRAKLSGGFGFVTGVMINFGRAGIGFNGVAKLAQAGGMLRFGQEIRRSVFTGGRRYLDLKLAEPVEDQRPGFSLMGTRRVRTTYSLLDLLRRAKEDRAVKGLLLRIENENMSFARAQEVRAALVDFKNSGKQIWVYAPNLGMVGFYLASGADRIILHPMGGVVIPGVSARTTFLKELLEKLGVKVQVHRYGEYKSAVEAFTEESLSVANREQLQALVDGIYEDFINATSTGRNLSSAEMESLVGRAFFRADEAMALGLIDTVCYEEELDSLLARGFKRTRRVDEKSFARQKFFSDRWDEPGKIAVIYVTGSINTGESGSDFLTGDVRAGSTTIVRAIKEAVNDRRVKGIVLRVDSPGGDGYASDLIWYALKRARLKKPVVVSMGGVAASGGYYVSCPADKIFALPGTITGSIGVFSLRLITEGLYNKIGVRRQVVKRGEHADALSDLRELTPEEDSILQGEIDWFYQQFVQKVAEGRGLSVEQVDSVARGRVWLAEDARRFGLVDSLAGLLEAIDFCREKAGLGRDYDVVFYPRPKAGLGSLPAGLFERLFFELLGR